MKTLKISADNEISIIDVNFDDFKSIQKALGGHFETVHTVKMNNYFQGPVIMLVDEEGYFKNLPLNRFGKLDVRHAKTWFSNLRRCASGGSAL